MSDQDTGQIPSRIAPQAGGTSTPIAGSKDGTGEKDPVVSEEAGQDIEAPTQSERT